MKKEKHCNAFKIFVPQNKLAMFLNDSLWPEGVSFRRFVYSNKTKNCANSNSRISNWIIIMVIQTSTETKTTFNFISFNCKSIKRSIDCVKKLCSSADIIALQETWLFPYDIPMLGTIVLDFAYTGTSAMDISTGVFRGRPYGGVAILWRKSMFKEVTVINCKKTRLFVQ